VARLSSRDVAAMLDIVHEGIDSTSSESFPRVVLVALARLIPSDALLGYQRVDVSSGCALLERVEIVGQEVPPSVAEASRASALARQDPLRDPLRARERRVLNLSSMLTRRQLRRLGFYQEVWRPLGIDDCLRVWLPASNGFAEVIFLERSKRDYSDRDRTILALLRPHLIRVRAKAAARRRARCAPGLTVREGEILALVAEGKTNLQIARLLYVSPHTVRKHVENIFDKLDVRTRTEAAAWLTSNGQNPRAVDEP
jgi:DNA-binding CsgD family transcriptional regulator